MSKKSVKIARHDGGKTSFKTIMTITNTCTEIKARSDSSVLSLARNSLSAINLMFVVSTPGTDALTGIYLPEKFVIKTERHNDTIYLIASLILIYLLNLISVLTIFNYRFLCTPTKLRFSLIATVLFFSIELYIATSPFIDSDVSYPITQLIESPDPNNYIGDREWVKDLTTEGIEPNPGPIFIFDYYLLFRAILFLSPYNNTNFYSSGSIPIDFYDPSMIRREEEMYHLSRAISILYMHYHPRLKYSRFISDAQDLVHRHKKFYDALRRESRSNYDKNRFDRNYKFVSTMWDDAVRWSNYFDRVPYEAEVDRSDLFCATSVDAHEDISISQWIRDLTREGIEPNPGPERYTKINPATIAFIAASKNKGNREYIVDKWKSKLRDKFIRVQRDRKFEPEAGINIGINDETKTFLKDLINQLASVFNGKLDVNFNFGIKSGFLALLQYAKDAGAFWFDLIRFILGFISEFIADQFRPLFAFISDLLPKQDVKFHRQMPGVPTTLFDADMTAESGFSLIGAATFWYFKDTLGRHVEERDFKRFVSLTKCFSDLTTVGGNCFEATLTCIRTTLEWLSTYFDVALPAFLRSGCSDLDNVYDRFKDLRNQLRDGIEDDYAFAEKVYLLQLDVEGLAGKYAKDPVLKQRFELLARSFTKLVDYCERSSAVMNGPRVEPASILFGGPTGAGKSTLTMPVLLAVLSQTIEKELLPAFKDNHNDFIFFRAPENKFMDGIKLRNKAIVYDDFGQLKDCAGNPNADAFEALRFINTAPFHLHFSAIEDKQKHYARPLIVMGTTNRPRLNFQSVVCPEAIVRRFKHSFVQAPKIDLCTDASMSFQPWERRFDINKLRKQYPEVPDNIETFIIPEAVDFIPWDFSKGEPTSHRVWSFDEVVQSVVDSIKANTHRGKNMIKYFGHIKDKYCNMRLDAESGIPSEEDDSDLDEFHDASDNLSSVMIKQFLKDTINAAVDCCLDFVGYKICKQFVQKYATIFIKLGAVVTAFCGMYGLFKGLQYLFSSSAESGDTSLNKAAAKTSKSISVTRAYKDRKIIRPMPELAPEGGDTQAFDWLRAIVKRNMYTVYCDEFIVGQVLFLKGTTFICPFHFDIMLTEYMIKTGRDSKEIIVDFKPCGSDLTSFSLNWMDFTLVTTHSADNIDLALYRVDKRSCRSHNDISNHFATKEKLSRGNRFRAYFPIFRDKGTVVHTTEVHLYDDWKYVTGGVQFSSKSLVYSVPSQKGDCGSPFVSSDGRFGKPVILGIHTAGDTISTSWSKTCAGVLLHLSLVKYLLECAEEEDPCVEEFKISSETMDAHGFGTIRRAPQPRMPSKSNIIRSPLYGKLWDINMRPSFLTPFTVDGERVDPRRIAQLKYLHNEPYVPNFILDEIEPFITRKLCRNFAMKPWEPRLLTYREAVGGIPGVKFCDGVARSKSAGYPHCLSSKYKGKTYWLGSEGDIDFDTPQAKELEDSVMTILDKTKKGIRVEFVYVDYLKDARVPIDKALKGKARQFNACPVELLILTRMYFGDFIRHASANRIFNGIAVGIDCYTEWDTLARYLVPTQGEYKLTAGDYSAYDTRIPVPVGLRVLSVIEAYYVDSSPEDRLVRRILFMNFVNSFHIADGIIYEHVGGNPSGQPITPHYNSIANMFIIYGAANWIRHTQNLTDDITVKDMFESVNEITYGDDNAIAYKDLVQVLFDQNNLSDAILKCFGMTYTNESKTDTAVCSRDLTEISFLKRSFRKTKYGYTCPLELSVLKETLNWTRNGNTEREFEIVIESVLRELSIHGKSVYDMYARKICKLSSEICNYIPINSNFETASGSDVGLACLF